MTRRACILGEPTGWHARRLVTALAARGCAATIVPWRDLAAGIEPAGERFAPPAFAAADLVVVRGMPGTGPVEARLEEVIFRMDVLGRLAARGTPVINPPRALEIAIDKYLSLAILAAAGLPVPKTVVVQDAAAAQRAWEELGGDCVVKPLFGSRGRGIHRGQSAAAVAAAVAADGGVAYLQEFLPHAGWDVRALVVGEEVVGIRREAAAGEWVTNLARGGRGLPLDVPPDWATLARRAAGAVGATLAGVDLVPIDDGRVVVLEVNAVPGWRGLEEVVGRDVSGAVADHLLAAAAM
jgi:ribosomal protein S6--L-glutamate ligase